MDHGVVGFVGRFRCGAMTFLTSAVREEQGTAPATPHLSRTSSARSTYLGILPARH
jgi:hypothetical protein